MQNVKKETNLNLSNKIRGIQTRMVIYKATLLKMPPT